MNWKYTPVQIIDRTAHILSYPESEHPEGRVYKIEVSAFDTYKSSQNGKLVTKHRIVKDDPRLMEIVKDLLASLNRDHSGTEDAA